MGGITTAFFFISLPAIIVFGPPLILGGMWYTRRLRRAARELHDARWSNMGSYHLSFADEPTHSLAARASIPDNAKQRILRALENNEQGISDLLFGQDVISAGDTVAFTPVELMEQDFRADSTGFQQRMELRRYGLIRKDRGSRIANICIVIHSNVAPGSPARMRVELTSISYRPKTFVLDAPSDDSSDSDVVIDVKPKRRR
jgi:hypothetical protein